LREGGSGNKREEGIEREGGSLQHNTALRSLTYGSFTKESPKEFATWFPDPEPDPLYVVNPPGATKRIGEWRG
jgi:hypothetical protein